MVLADPQDNRKRARMAETATARRPFLYLIIGMFTVIALWGYVSSLQASYQEPWTTDFMRLHLASSQMLAGQNPYNAPLAEARYLERIGAGSVMATGRHATLESPAVLLLLAPLTRLEPSTAFLIWTLLSVLAAIASLLLLEERLGPLHPDTNLQAGPHRLCLLLAAVIFFYPAWISMVIGQTGFVTLLVLTLGWCWARERRDGPAGLALGAAVALLPALSILAFYFLALSRFRVLAAAILTTLLGLFIPALLIDFSILESYLQALRAVNWFGAGWNASLVGFLAPFLGNSANAAPLPAPWLTLILLLAAGAVGLRALWTLAKMAFALEQKAANEHAVAVFDLGFAFCLPLALLLSPLAWVHSFVLLLPAFGLALEACARRPRDWRWREKILFAWVLAAIPYPVLRAEANTSLYQWIGIPAFDSYALIILTLTLWGLCRREANVLLQRHAPPPPGDGARETPDGKSREAAPAEAAGS